jgi:hypothetical protein
MKTMEIPMTYRVDHKLPATESTPNPRWIYGTTTDARSVTREYRRWRSNGYIVRLSSLQATYATPIERVLTQDQIDELERAVDAAVRS